MIFETYTILFYLYNVNLNKSIIYIRFKERRRFAYVLRIFILRKKIIDNSKVRVEGGDFKGTF
jgi:hypothetical protein